MHWAAKRGHASVVKYLLASGADPSLKSLYGESAFAVAKNDEIKELLCKYTAPSCLERHIFLFILIKIYK